MWYFRCLWRDSFGALWVSDSGLFQSTDPRRLSMFFWSHRNPRHWFILGRAPSGLPPGFLRDGLPGPAPETGSWVVSISAFQNAAAMSKAPRTGSLEPELWNFASDTVWYRISMVYLCSLCSKVPHGSLLWVSHVDVAAPLESSFKLTFGTLWHGTHVLSAAQCSNLRLAFTQCSNSRMWESTALDGTGRRDMGMERLETTQDYSTAYETVMFVDFRFFDLVSM